MDLQARLRSGMKIGDAPFVSPRWKTTNAPGVKLDFLRENAPVNFEESNHS